MKKLFLLLVTVLTIGICASAQTRTISGTVLDAANDEPVMGATVMPIGGGQGVSTDVDGNFTITVPSSVKTLRVSCVGYHTSDVAVASGKMMIRLKSSTTELEDVIVIAYGQAKKSAYTGSASVIKADEIEGRLVTNAANALSGTAAGVQLLNSNGQPGVSPTIRIRGVGSINASAAPLYVVDGMPFSGDLSTLNTMDIESMTVLKDAASAALYGARGANGVILITTKGGREGKAKVTFDARWGVNSPEIPNYQVVSQAGRYYELAYQAQYNSFISAGYGDLASYNMANNALLAGTSSAPGVFGAGYQVFTAPVGQNLIGTDGKLNPNATLGYSNGVNYFTPDNWRDETLQNGLRQEYNLAITGGNDRYTYYVSTGYLGDEGLIEGSNYNRLAARAATDYNAFKWLKVGTNLAYNYIKTGYPSAQTTSNSSSNAFAIANKIAPIYPMYIRNADGSLMMDNRYNRPVYDYGDGKYAPGAIRNFMNKSNPASDLIYSNREYLMDILQAKAYATITPIDRLNVTGSVGYYLDNTRYHNVTSTQYGQMATYGGTAAQQFSRSSSLNLQALATYSWSIGESNNFDALLGFESYESRSETLYVEGQTLYQTGVFVINNTLNNSNRQSEGYTGEYATRGFFGRLNYDYQGRYFGSVSFRRDASSRFAPNKRWGNFFSLSAGWDIAKESFMQDQSTWLDLLKVKASYGQQGNDGIGNNYAYLDQYQITGVDSWSDGVIVYKGNPDLTWETSHAINAGVDFSLWQSKLSGTVEYFSRKTSDMLYNKPVAPSNGYSSIPMNIGSMRNQGVEIELFYTPVRTKDITWTLNFNGTFIKNKIIALHPDLKGEMISGRRILREGDSLYQFYLVQYAGVGQQTRTMTQNGKEVVVERAGEPLFWSRYVYTNSDGKWTDANGVELDKDLQADGKNPSPVYSDAFTTIDYNQARQNNRQALGNSMPNFYGGFGTSLQLFGFDVSAQFAFQTGGKMYDAGYTAFMHRGSSGDLGTNWHVDATRAWTPQNTNTNIPSLNSTGVYSLSSNDTDFGLISSNYLSLNNITIGYTLPSSLTKKWGIESIRVYGAADNVAVFSRRKGLDPRTSYTEGSMTSYSAVRNISGGLKVVF